MAIDINDEEALLAEISDEFDLDDDVIIDISDLSGRWMGYDGSDAKLVEIDSDEYVFFPSEEAAEEVAKQYVLETIQSEPEVFNQDWLQGYINEEKLSKWVRDVQLEDDYADDLARYETDRFWEEAGHWGVEDLPEPDEDGNMPDDVDDKYIEDLKERIAEDRARDPMAYLNEIYSEDEAIKKALEIAGIDEERAAQDAVNADGWAHFLSSWDGESHETANGLVYVIQNKPGDRRPRRRGPKFTAPF